MQPRSTGECARQHRIGCCSGVLDSRGRPWSLENGPASGYRRKRAAEKLEAAGSGWPQIRRRESYTSSRFEKTGSVSSEIHSSVVRDDFERASDEDEAGVEVAGNDREACCRYGHS